MRGGKGRRDEERGGGDEWMDGVRSDITLQTSHHMDPVTVTVTVASRVRVLNSAQLSLLYTVLTLSYLISFLLTPFYSTLLCCTLLCCTLLLYGYHLKRIRTDYYTMYV
jgi:hypothetical protein